MRATSHGPVCLSECFLSGRGQGFSSCCCRYEMKRAHDFSGAEKRRRNKKKQDAALKGSQLISSFVSVQPSPTPACSQSDDDDDDDVDSSGPAVQTETQNPATKAHGDHAFHTPADVPPGHGPNDYAADVACADGSGSGSANLCASETVNSDNEPLELQLEEKITLEPSTSFRRTCMRITDDPASWLNLSDTDRIQIVTKGPVQVFDYDFPFNDQVPKRRFTTNNYYLTLLNSEKVRRSWFVYSKSADSVYCFPCVLFADGKCRSSLASQSGFGSRWSTLSKALKEHEGSTSHKENMLKWHTTRSDDSVDKLCMKQIREEQKYWRSVLWRLLSIVQFLAERNLAFRGSTELLGDPRNGNFLGEVELVAKFDPIMAKHVRRAKNHDLTDHYLSNTIQHELISLLGTATQEKNCCSNT